VTRELNPCHAANKYWEIVADKLHASGWAWGYLRRGFYRRVGRRNFFTKSKSVVSKQEELIAKQQKQIEALTATVQKVSDQIALSKPSPQLVTNP
jgi:hypothetical protein